MIYYSCIFLKTDYVHMLMILYSSLLKNITLDDTYYVMADEETIKHITDIPMLKQIKLIKMPTPKTVIEGMSWRYQLHRHIDILSKCVCYMDVDMICIRPFNFNFQESTDELLIYPEGQNDDRNYSSTGGTLAIPYGATSGFFAAKYGPNVLQFMEEVHYTIRRASVKHYTLDQIHFNTIIEKRFKEQFIKYMPSTILSFNGHNNKDTAVFINCCGDPGNGKFHLSKMLEFILG